MKRIAFVCDTPYQLFTMLAIVLSEEKLKDYLIDLYIDTKRSNKSSMEVYFQNILEQKIFSNVYEVNSLSSSYKVLNKIEWLFPKLSLRIGSRGYIHYNEYECIFVSGPFMLQRNIINYFKPKKICFFEDGTGSYTGRIGVNLLNKYGKILQKITKRGPEHIYPCYSYLFCPDLYEGEYKQIIKKISFPNDKFFIFNRVFGDVSNQKIYERKKAIYLSQPVTDNDIDDDKNIIKHINKYSKLVIAKPHPQDIKKDFLDMDVDSHRGMWEMMCYESVSENTILIGKYSTAQITPKLVFGKEPVIIFTYYLYKEKNVNIENAISSIEKIYINEDRIYIPKTYGELEQILELLLC